MISLKPVTSLNRFNRPIYICGKYKVPGVICKELIHTPQNSFIELNGVWTNGGNFFTLREVIPAEKFMR